MEVYTNQLFDLDYAELKGMLEDPAGPGICSISYEPSDRTVGMPGICGEYAIPRLTLEYRGGPSDTITLFARRQLDSKESKQAHHYRYFRELGIPAPRLYGAKCDDKGREILLLEYAQEIPDEKSFFASEGNIKAFLDLAARLSSVKPPLDYLALMGRDMGSKSDTRDWKTWMAWAINIIGRIWTLAGEDKLGDDLKRLCASDVMKTELQRAAFALIGRINSLGVGIVHSDFRPANMVLLPDGGQLGLIDFEDVILDARHYDLARYLGAPESLFKWDAGLRDDYIDYFLQRAAQHGEGNLSHSGLKAELFHIWYTRSINLWEWLPQEFGGPSYEFWPAGRTKKERCRNIYILLKALIDSRKELML